jgi:hypothetical protein
MKSHSIECEYLAGTRRMPCSLTAALFNGVKPYPVVKVHVCKKTFGNIERGMYVLSTMLEELQNLLPNGNHESTSK